ncbi:hypothetical protein [Methanoregula sp.]|uniref:hypothetical protein n=1 Tax=Methanoregula sp. TaxID=2052170 RepID=UPI002D7F63AD|nr:hypothetical protein [Methanoregula sp.]
MCAIVAGISFLLVVGAIGFMATFPPGYQEMLFKENLLNPSLLTIALLAGGAYCGSLILFIWYLH